MYCQVLEAASRKDLDDGTGQKEVKVTPEKLKKNIQLFASDIEAFNENAGLLQVNIITCFMFYLACHSLMYVEGKLINFGYMFFLVDQKFGVSNCF